MLPAAGRRHVPQAEAADGPPSEAVPGHHPDQQGEQHQGPARGLGHCLKQVSTASGLRDPTSMAKVVHPSATWLLEPVEGVLCHGAAGVKLAHIAGVQAQWCCRVAAICAAGSLHAAAQVHCSIG
jgi:hypothetical protein